SHTITPVADFTNSGAIGYHPQGGLIEDNSGNVFGTTYGGSPYDKGTVFEVQTGTNIIKTLAEFNDDNGTSGAYPQSSLIEDSNGNLFGTTYYGGAFKWGTIFEVPGATPAVSITTPSLPSWIPNEPGYSQILSAAGGTAPYAFAVTSGSLPAGLALDP